MLGTTVPAGSAIQSFVLELILTAILMFVILSVSTGAAEKGMTAGIVVGAVIGLEAMFAGPICGASMNPARSLGPALMSDHLQHLWIYLLAPVIGVCIGVLGCRCVRESGCCSGRGSHPTKGTGASATSKLKANHLGQS
jgi:aquaporin NIP